MDAFADLERAREAVVAEGAAFTAELEPVLRESLRRGFERLCVDHAHFVQRLDDPTRGALEQAADRSIDVGVAAVIERLRSPELWLAPLTAPHLAVVKEEGWPDWLPEAFARPCGRAGASGRRSGSSTTVQPGLGRDLGRGSRSSRSWRSSASGRAGDGSAAASASGRRRCRSRTQAGSSSVGGGATGPRSIG